MERIPVDSSMIKSVGYEVTSEELEVQFNSGAVYRYRGVPIAVYEELLAADSKGQYMHNHIIAAYPHYQLDQ